MKRAIILLTAALAAVSCGNGAKIKGRIICGSGSSTVYLESVTPAGQRVVDSTATDDGYFSFKIKLADGQPAIYNLRCHDQIVPLLVSPGESVKVSGFGNVSRTYTVEGSQGSAEMRELTMILNNGAAKLDSLMNVATRIDKGDTTHRNPVLREYVRNYYSIKQQHIKFIVAHPHSIAAIYGLYQRLPNDNTLFNGADTDVVYYRMVADSVTIKYPKSQYLKALQSDIERMDLRMAGIDPDKIHAVNYPDIDLPDMYGNKRKLSSLEGNVLLIDFWSGASQQCRTLNADLKELYGELHPMGFEVYQVSVDTSKPIWVSTVQDQKLPWVTVCDFLGEASTPVRLYNVHSVPSNFLLDRHGNFAGKNLYGKELADKVKSLL